MKRFYTEIKLTSEFQNYLDVDLKPFKVLEGLSLVNIFVGSNNSGKSRFLREIAKINKFEFHQNIPNTKEYIMLINNLSKELHEIKTNEDFITINEIEIKDFGKFKPTHFSVISKDFYLENEEELNSNFKALLIALKSNNFVDVTSYSGKGSRASFDTALKFFVSSRIDKINDILNFEYEHVDYGRYYIPILRSLNNFQLEIGKSNKDEDFIDFLKSRTYSVYKFNTSQIDIVTGQDFYTRVRDMLLGEEHERLKIAQFEHFLGEEIFHEKIILIPKSKHDVLNVKIGNAKDRPIFDLGDGIQSLIILTLQMFIEDNALFFIEEPELHLHPGMQRKLLELILNSKTFKDKNHQYFFTTHSNHFLDLTLDYQQISIYKFNSSNDDIKIVEQVNSGDENILQELGVKNSSVFLTNATIWVEGITDRLYIRKFLELYQLNKDIKIQEDLDYSFVEYGGNNITHWSFLDSEIPPILVDRLCGKLILITDKDGERKLARKTKLKEKLQDRYECLSCLEIENILSHSTLEKAIRGFPKDREFILPININRKYHNFKNFKIGSYIKENLKPRNTYHDAKNGSLNSSKKLDFCRNATKTMVKEDMTKLAVELAEKIYSFVLSQNRIRN